MTETATTYDEWQAARLGCVTASRVADVVAQLKDGKPAASRKNYMTELLLERLTGTPQDQNFQSDAMLRGIQLEPDALAMYEWAQDVAVGPGVFIPHPTIPESGATPDGFVGTEGLVEVKCPNAATHWATLEGGSIDSKYLTQIQWQLATTGRDYCDFVSYDPRFPDGMQLYRERITRDDSTIFDLELKVTAFLDELSDKELWARETFNA